MKFLLFLIFLPLFGSAQLRSTVAKYQQIKQDSTFTFAKGFLKITPATVTVDNSQYTITTISSEYIDPYTNDHWITLNDGIMLVHYNSNWTLGSVFIGTKSYYFY